VIELDDYQLNAVSRMRNGCVLNGAVGSGKSLTSLYYYFKEQGGSWENHHVTLMENPRDLYIITTARKRDEREWEGELAYFNLSTNPELSFYKNHRVIVDSWNNIKKYSNVMGAFFIFDEDRVTGSGAWVKAFLKIARGNRWIIASATAGDCWMDYWAVFVANKFYRNKTEFIDEHVVYSNFTKYRKIDRYIGTAKLLSLREQILVEMEYTPHTVQHHIDIPVEYDIRNYKDATKNRWHPYRNRPMLNAAELCYVWRRIVNTDESREVALLEILEKHPRIVVFYNFDYERDILLSIHYGDKVRVAEWNGHSHQPVPKSKSWVYLVNYGAGAEGWNCTATDTMVFYSQNYSYRTMTQAAGRIDRRNTPYRDLYYYHFKSKSPIDVAISRAVSNKKKFNELKFSKW
jgi:hypothetical protein